MEKRETHRKEKKKKIWVRADDEEGANLCLDTPSCFPGPSAMCTASGVGRCTPPASQGPLPLLPFQPSLCGLPAEEGLIFTSAVWDKVRFASANLDDQATHQSIRSCRRCQTLQHNTGASCPTSCGVGQGLDPLRLPNPFNATERRYYAMLTVEGTAGSTVCLLLRAHWAEAAAPGV